MIAPLLAATLIVALPSSDGLTVCADRRTWSPDSGVSDSYRKLLPAGDRAVFSVTGQVEAQTRDGAILFSAERAVEAGIRKYGFPTLAGFSSFAKNAILDPLVASGTLTMFQPTESPRDWVFQVSFYYYLGNDPIEVDVHVFYQKDVDRVPRAEVNAVRFSAPDSYSLHGATLVPIEMMSGHDPRFDGMRKVYASFRDEKRPSAEDVMKFERWLIRESSRRTHELTDAQKRKIYIGATSDCARVSATGVEWFLNRPHPSERSSRSVR